MSLLMQILSGSCLLTFCALVHVLIVAGAMPYFATMAHSLRAADAFLRNIALMGFAVVVTVFAHTVQIWGWAATLFWLDAFADFPTNFYFATVTYTTLGYGDLILEPGLRVFASFASITGMLTFGISTALLVGLVTRLLSPDQ